MRYLALPVWQLRETVDGICQGVCPVCTERWAADPDLMCSCTRPRPGDVAEAVKVTTMQIRCRTATHLGNARRRDEAAQASRELRARHRR